MDARFVFNASPNSALTVSASRSHNTRLSVTSGGSGRPGYASGGRCGDGTVSCWNVTDTARTPSLSATDSAPAAAGIAPVATITSQPSTAAGSASNWLAMIRAAASGMDDGRGRGDGQLASRRADRYQLDADGGEPVR